MYNKLIINLLCALFVVVLLIILGFMCTNTTESFTQGIGYGFARYYSPMPRCDSKNNCFRGSYFSGTQYLNMCEPKKGLLKQKKKLIDNRYRKL